MKAEKNERYSLRAHMMACNIAIMLGALLLCGLVFAGSIWVIIGNYFRKDIDFFLTEISSNLNAKTEYMERILYSIRDTELLMNYLKGGINEQDALKLPGLLSKVTDISNLNNVGRQRAPFVEKIYLFRDRGDFIRSTYYAMTYEQLNKSDMIMNQIYAEFITEENIKYKYYSYDQNLYLAFTVYNEDMNAVGTVIYDIGWNGMNEILDAVAQYRNSFWILSEQNGKVIKSPDLNLSNNELIPIIQNWNYSAYEDEVQGAKYIIYSQNLCMGLRSTIAIPANHMVEMMYTSFGIYIIIILVITIASAIIFIGVIYHFTKPLGDITGRLQLVQEGNFKTKLPEYPSREFHEISMTFNQTTEYVNHLINQVYEKQLSIKEMELKFLQTQMNPHFMFNVLNTIALQARLDGNEQTFKMINSFSQLIRAKIYSGGKEKVKISQELEYVDYYLYLQSFRYGERLNYEIDVEEPKLKEYFLPKLCIQLIVENAVVHGIEPMIDNGKVQVKIYSDDIGIYIDTIDNGVGFGIEGEITLPIEYEGESPTHNHIGLNNANHIIQLTYGEEYGIHIFSDNELGTMVRIHIPFDKGATPDENRSGSRDVQSNYSR